nr:hypothetical protein CFP56_09055 [Quercus suber]
MGGDQAGGWSRSRGGSRGRGPRAEVEWLSMIPSPGRHGRQSRTPASVTVQYMPGSLWMIETGESWFRRHVIYSPCRDQRRTAGRRCRCETIHVWGVGTAARLGHTLSLTHARRRSPARKYLGPERAKGAQVTPRSTCIH